MIVTNSTKGDEFWTQVLHSCKCNFSEISLDDSNYVFKTEEERYNKAFLEKKKFLKIYEKYGFEKAARKNYFKGVELDKFKMRIRRIIGK